MKIICKILAFGTIALSVGGCDLTMLPEHELSPEQYFQNESDLTLWSNQFYNDNLESADIGINDADDKIDNGLSDYITGSRNAASQTWSFSALRKINYLLEHLDQCPDRALATKYEAVARFFRAYFYFEKVKRFGDVPWYDQPLKSDNPDLYKARDSREFVMSKILEDIDYAIAKLPQEQNVYSVTQWTALALKSRICLFEGTFRKYHGIAGHEKYLDECIKAAERFIDESPYLIYKGSSTPYRDLFSSNNAISTEVILARDYEIGLNIIHNANNYTLSNTYGMPGLNKKIVDSYLKSDGSRFTDVPGYSTMEFYQEMQGRDPRLTQTVRGPGYTRIGQTARLSPDFSCSTTGYQLTKWVTDVSQDGYNKSYNDIILFRAAEVYLNFAEAKAERGTLTQDDINKSIKPIRDRVGMPNLDMKAANANPDPYLASNVTGYPNVSGENKGVILEIRRERTVELLMENLRYWDIMRWKEGKRFEKPFTGLYFPGTGSYDLNNDGVDDVCIWSGSKPATSAPAVYELNKEIFLSGGDSGYIIIHTDYARSWNEERDYLYPVPTDDRVLTQGAITQNPGWNDGLNF